MLYILLSGSNVSHITDDIKNSQYDKFAEAVSGISEALQGIIEASAQAAYLVAVSDPSSTSARPALINQAQVAKSAEEIEQGCSDLAKSEANHEQVNLHTQFPH